MILTIGNDESFNATQIILQFQYRDGFISMPQNKRRKFHCECVCVNFSLSHSIFLESLERNQRKQLCIWIYEKRASYKLTHYRYLGNLTSIKHIKQIDWDRRARATILVADVDMIYFSQPGRGASHSTEWICAQNYLHIAMEIQ